MQRNAVAPFPGLLASPWFHFASGALLAILLLFFAAAHVAKFAQTRDWGLLVFCAAEAVTAGLLLVRMQPKSFAKSPLVWLVAALGTFAPLLLRPTTTALVPGTQWGVLLGTCVEIAAALSLNRSYAIVPSLREVKTGGLYGFVRHPIYASYLITLTSYLLGNYSVANLVLWLVTIALLLVRAHLEEAHLSADPAYRDYCGRVRWHVIPGVY
jgi:protein-S-isoprenylcysteine O-methyltransferase Ste14